MFFTKSARIIAWLLVTIGGSRAAVGLTAAFTDNQALATRYLGSAPIGETIDKGLLYILIGLAVGTVAEISRSVATRPNGPKEEK